MTALYKRFFTFVILACTVLIKQRGVTDGGKDTRTSGRLYDS